MRRPTLPLASVAHDTLRGLTGALVLACTLSPLGVSAQLRTPRPYDDGVYGRFGTDLVLSFGANAGIGVGDPVVSARGSSDPVLVIDAELRLRVFDSAGIVVSPEWRPEGASRLIAAIELRPVFLARFVALASTGDRYADLFLDSLGVELGATVFAPDGRVAVAFAVGFGAEVPLWIPPENSGALALRLGARWTGAGSSDVWGPDRIVDDWTVHAGLLVRFHLNVGLASWEPDRYRTR